MAAWIQVDDVLHVRHKRARRRRKGNMSGLRKARCVRRKMADGKTKTRARKLCGVKR